jgi:hypothetical protein
MRVFPNVNLTYVIISTETKLFFGNEIYLDKLLRGKRGFPLSLRS